MSDLLLANDDIDLEWFEYLRRSLTQNLNDLPSWPSSYTQEVFVGYSGEAALAEAFKFFQRVRNSSPRFNPNAHILDFGVGWGRIIRCFYRDLPATNLHGVDVDPAILDEARRTGVRGDLQLINGAGKLPFKNKSMDIVYAFSVFSHLSEPSAQHWLIELMRVLKPGGTLIFTSTTIRFIELCAACKAKVGERNMHESIYAGMFDDPLAAMERYRRGEHVFAKSKGAADALDEASYGWASVPLLWVEKNLNHSAKSVEFSDDGSFEQGIFVITKKDSWLSFF